MEDRIMPFFASVSVGGEFNLLSEWADGDLESFLQEESRSFGLCDLMEEARNLAGALAFLHGGPNSKQLFCHLDLKPANILVFRESPTSVGRWKISDFGNSVFTPATGPWPDGSFPPMSNLGGIVGTYQSPEVFYGEGLGRKSDVWSLGCILVRILAFGLGGSVLRDLDNRRRQMMINGEPSCHDCFHCRYPPVLNPHIETWIKGLPTRSNHQLMQQACQRFRSLLLRTLEVNKEARLTAEEVKGGLGSILKILLPPKSFLPSTLSIDASHLLTSIQNGDFDGLGSQLRYNVDVEVPTEDAGKKERLLVHGIRRNSYETVESLLDSRPRMDIESPASDGQTPLACVIATGDKRIFKLLLEAGANIDAPSKNGITPLMLATEYGHVSIVRSLLDSGAECLAYCNKGYTCVHYIAWARKGGVQMIAEFQGRGSYLNLRCRGGNESPLSTLIKAHDETDEWQSKFNAFLAAGVDVNSPDQRGRTPLYYAGLDDLKEVAIKLLQKGARLSPDLEPALLDRKVPSWMKALLREHDGGSNGSLHEPRSSWRAALRRMRSS
ncbi:ankyrin repeat-containing domain protein [Aspergillus multicolor]|uniref:ankyrin repeat and protein kinase domain-containing protein n=1 Tax=Aspergillus multicolor TaxID=41759 RepID=UPI003CCCFE2B